jgi:hypothetical protein
MRSVLLGLWCVLVCGSVAAAPPALAPTFAPSLCWGACAARLGAPRALQPAQRATQPAPFAARAMQPSPADSPGSERYGLDYVPDILHGDPRFVPYGGCFQHDGRSINPPDFAAEATPPHANRELYKATLDAAKDVWERTFACPSGRTLPNGEKCFRKLTISVATFLEALPHDFNLTDFMNDYSNPAYAVFLDLLGILQDASMLGNGERLCALGTTIVDIDDERVFEPEVMRKFEAFIASADADDGLRAARSSAAAKRHRLSKDANQPCVYVAVLCIVSGDGKKTFVCIPACYNGRTMNGARHRFITGGSGHGPSFMKALMDLWGVSDCSLPPSKVSPDLGHSGSFP